MRWTLPLLFICLSCQSKTISNHFKPTPHSANTNLIELETVVLQTPPQAQELESAIVTNPEIQECLRAALKNNPIEFSLGIEGNLSTSGAIQGARADTPSAPLQDCVQRATNHIQMGQNGGGAFKMRISRPGPGGSKAKTFLLDATEVKKFQ